MPIYIANERVAWELERKIGQRFLDGYYQPWGAWYVREGKPAGARVGICGELRLRPALPEPKREKIQDAT